MITHNYLQITIQLIDRHEADGLCPVCHVRKSDVWPDGVGRMTCGDERCFYKWTTGREPMPVEQLREIRNRELNEIGPRRT